MNEVICGECSEFLNKFRNQVNLVVTSPPYDNLRDYKGYTFEFEKVASAIFECLVDTGVLVWVVSDQMIDGSESCSSFRQALHFKSLGMFLNDTMIWKKPSFTALGNLTHRYAQVFEYMFVFTKSRKYPYHPLKDRPNNEVAGQKISGRYGRYRLPNGELRKQVLKEKFFEPTGIRHNVWDMPGEMSSLKRGHPAPMQEHIAISHILSWSNPGDLVLDPMCGGGTTLLAAKKTGRNYLGIDISDEYCNMSRKRLGECNTRIKVTNIYKFITDDGEIKINAETLEEAERTLGQKYLKAIDFGILKYEEVSES